MANDSQRRPTKTHNSQCRPTQAHNSPRKPTQPSSSRGGSRRDVLSPGYVFFLVSFLILLTLPTGMPAKANTRQWKPMAANVGQRQPTKANVGQWEPMSANAGPEQPMGNNSQCPDPAPPLYHPAARHGKVRRWGQKGQPTKLCFVGATGVFFYGFIFLILLINIYECRFI